MTDLISRDAAVAVLVNEIDGDDYENDGPLTRCIVRIRALPSIAPDPIEAEYVAAAVALAEAAYAMDDHIENHISPQDVDERVRLEISLEKSGLRFAAARAARDGAR